MANLKYRVRETSFVPLPIAHLAHAGEIIELPEEQEVSDNLELVSQDAEVTNITSRPQAI